MQSSIPARSENPRWRTARSHTRKGSGLVPRTVADVRLGSAHHDNMERGWQPGHASTMDRFEMDLSRPIVLGHEYVAEIVDFGPDTQRKLQKGTRVTSQAVDSTPRRVRIVGSPTITPVGSASTWCCLKTYLRRCPIRWIPT